MSKLETKSLTQTFKTLDIRVFSLIYFTQHVQRLNIPRITIQACVHKGLVRCKNISYVNILTSQLYCHLDNTNTLQHLKQID
jgi:hypothetical protein